MVRREDRVKRVLGQVRDRCAYVVLDLAPSLSLVSLAALVAATGIIAPMNATRLGVGALGTFLGWIDDFRAEDVITAPLLVACATRLATSPRGRPTC
jgi:cellulose biosynthesis protein BcsQ